MRRILILPVLILLLAAAIVACKPAETDWGSFTDQRTESYDQKYYAVPTADGPDIVVAVYDAGSGTEVFSFRPARASDFWGICWESDTYNIWIQSADIGTLCYQFDGERWILNENAERPADIESKYD